MAFFQTLRTSAAIALILGSAAANGDVVGRSSYLLVAAAGNRCILLAQWHSLIEGGSLAGLGGRIDDGDPVHWLVCDAGKPARLSEDLSNAIAQASKIDRTLEDFDSQETRLTQACTKHWCIDLSEDAPKARSSDSREIRSLPKEFSGRPMAVVSKQQSFIAWQPHIETQRNVEQRHEIFRWDPREKRVEKFVLRR